MALTQKYRGGLGCELCGEVVKWVRLISGLWIAVQPEPVLFIPGEGRNWLISFDNYDAIFMKNCLIFKRGKGMDTSKVIEGYMPHAWVCPGR